MFRPAAIICILFLQSNFAFADVPATQPATAPADDPPVPAALVPGYLAIGRDLSVQLSVVRRTVDELSLDPQIQKQADELINATQGEVDSLIGQFRQGQLPSNRRVLSVPSDMHAARGQLIAMIGREAARMLSVKLQSIRGDARMQLGRLQAALGDLQQSAAEKTACDGIIADAAASVEKLPDSELIGDEYAAARQAMTELLGRVHDHLASILTPAEQAKLGSSFTMLPTKPTTRKS